MSQELVKYETNIIDWNCANQLKTIKDIYGKKLTNEEFGVFVNLGRATGLNPFLKEIWAIKFGDAAASIFVARDGYRKSAQQNHNYDYHLSDSVYSNDHFKVVNGEVEHSYKVSDRGTLVGAYCIVKRKSSSKPNFVYVELKEYNLNQGLWKTKPSTMIKKVAEAQCLKMAFQELFAGSYSEDEFEPVDNSKEAKKERASNHVNHLIEGKVEHKNSSTYDEIVNIINLAETVNDLSDIPELSKNLSENELIFIRRMYAEKKKQLEKVEYQKEEISEFEKIKKQLLNAKSKDTLDIAADLINTIENEKEHDELLQIYVERKDTLK